MKEHKSIRAYIEVDITKEEVLTGALPICFELSRILQEYSEMLKNGQRGVERFESFLDGDGNEISVAVFCEQSEEVKEKINSLRSGMVTA